MRELYQAAIGGKGHSLDDEQLSESLASALRARPKGAGWWVFAYGSLLWNPLFPFAEARPATLRGLHRRFCLYSMASRGTRETPGLVLALDRGGACVGVVYRLPAPVVIEELHLLWRRGMGVGAYWPKWGGGKGGNRRLVPRPFTLKQDPPQNRGKFPISEKAPGISHTARAFRFVPAPSS